MTPQPNAHINLNAQKSAASTQRSAQPPLAKAWGADAAPDTVTDALADTVSGTDSGFDHPSFGMPGDRQARLAARRAFVALKLSFLYVVEGIDGPPELRTRVRLAEEPHELWSLRAPVFAVLGGDDPQHRSRRQLLNRSLETMFPTATPQLN